MKVKTSIVLTVVLTFGLFPLEHSTWAQSARGLFGPRGNPEQSTNSNCKKIKGRSVSVFDPATGIVSGPITNAGFLNGPAEDVINFNAGFFFTPDPNVVAYTSDLTITTVHGQLKASTVTTQSVVTGAGVEWGSINPDASTGRFAGATGMIIFSFKPVGDPSIGPYEAEITGEICFANEW